MNVLEELKEKTILLDKLRDAMILVLKKDHRDLLNQIIQRHLELCKEWDEKQEGEP